MSRRQIRVFIASPGDLQEERKGFRDVVEELNLGFGDGADVEFIPLGWEDTLATTGRRPQAVINDEIDLCDVFILVFHRRWGQTATDSAPYDSYTEEEFHRALTRFSETGSPTIFVFFKHLTPADHAEPDEHIQKVLAFRRQLEASRRVFYRAFSDEAAFRPEVDAHLRAFAKGTHPTPDAGADRLILPLEYLKKVEEAKADVEKTLRRAEREKDRATIANARQAIVSLRLSERAATAAMDGRLEDARQDFALAIEGTVFGATLFLAYEFYFRTGDLAAAERVVGRIIAAPIQEKNIAAIALGSMAAIYDQRGQYDRAEALYVRACGLFEQMGNVAGLADGLSSLGLVYSNRGQLERAEEVQRRGLVLVDSGGTPRQRLVQFTNLGATYSAQGELGKANEIWEKALPIAEGLGDEEATANLYANLGGVHQHRGNLGRAEELIGRALSTFEKLGHAKHTAIQYHRLAKIHRDRREFETSERYYRKALALNEASGYVDGVARDLGGLGMLFLDRNQPDEAVTYGQRALEIHERIGNMRGLAAAVGDMGVIRLRGREFEKAETLLKKAIALFEAAGDKNGIAINCSNLGAMYRERGDVGRAVTAHERALEVFQAIGGDTGAATQLECLGVIYALGGEYDRAEGILRRAALAWESLGDLRRERDTRWRIASVYEKKGDFGLAVEAIQAIKDDDRCDDRVALLSKVAQGYDKRGERELAHETLRTVIALAEPHRKVWNAATSDVVAWSHVELAEAVWRRASGTDSSIDLPASAAMGAHYAEALALTSAARRGGVLTSWAFALQTEAETASADKADELLSEACAKCQEAVTVGPDDSRALECWGFALWSRARMSVEADAGQERYAEAVVKFEAALRHDAKNPELNFEFAELLVEMAGRQSQAVAEALYARACDTYEESNRLKRLEPMRIRWWATALAERIDSTPAGVPAALVTDAIGTMEAAASGAPPDAQTLYSWGYALMSNASTLSGSEAERSLAEAIGRLDAAVTIEPRYWRALQCRALAKMRLANRLGAETGKALLEGAGEDVRTSESICRAEETDEARTAAGWSRLLRCCIHVHLGEEAAARELLTEDPEAPPLPPRADILATPDLAALLSCGWFTPLLRE